jgi:hypothetical protein
MAGKKTAKLAIKGGVSHRPFVPKECHKCGKEISAAKDYLTFLEMAWISNHFARRYRNTHRACIKV